MLSRQIRIEYKRRLFGDFTEISSRLKTTMDRSIALRHGSLARGWGLGERIGSVVGDGEEKK